MTGNITSLPPAIQPPASSVTGNPEVLGPLSYVPAIPNLPQNWIAVQTFAAGTLVLQGTGGTSQYVKQSSLNAAVTVGPIVAADLPAGTVLSVVNDTNVTGSIASQVLTLGWSGTLAAARLNANVVQAITNDTNVTGAISGQTMTIGWSGTLAAGRLNSNVVQAITNDTNITGSISAQNLTLGWTGTLANARLANMSAYTIKGNNTAGSAGPTDIDITALTLKASPGASDIVLIQDVSAGNAFKRTTVSGMAASAGVSSLNGQTGALSLHVRPQGRITLTSGVPVLTSTVSGATTVYYTPYQGDIVPIYDGTNMVPTVFTELSQATTDATKSPAAVAASKNYDLFVWNDSGTIRCTRGPAWSSDTARGTGVGTTELQMINGILTNKNAITNGPAANRGTYVGSIFSNASSQIDYIFGAAAATPTAGVLGIWNCYNRVTTTSVTTDTTVSWTYATNTWRQARAQSTNQCTFIIGLSEDMVDATYHIVSSNTTADAYSSIGLDSTTVASGSVADAFSSSGQTVAISRYSGYPGIGKHFLAPIEATFSSTSTFRGGNNSSPSGNDSGFFTVLRN